MSVVHPREHLLALRDLVSLLVGHRRLTWEMTKRDISDRYVGQVLGLVWAVGHPLVLMGVYLFIFGYVFKVRIGGTRELPLDYSTYLLSGLIPWMALQECMARGSVAISANASLVKQVVFPIEVLPVKTVLSSLLMEVIYLVILTTYVLLSHHMLPWTYLLLPVLLALQAMFMIGVAYVLSSVGAYFRDLKDVIQVFCLIGLYATPIFYLPEMVPSLFRPLLWANPFSHMIWVYQDALYFGRFDHAWSWLVFVVLSVGLFYSGYRVFRKLKVYFGSVL